MILRRTGLVWVVLVSFASVAIAEGPANAAALRQKADVVVSGRVVAVRSHVPAAAPGSVVSDIDIEVVQVFKGEPAAVVTVLQPGGTVGDLTQVVSHQPRFVVGERVLVFLEKRPAQRYRVVFGDEGKFTLADEGDLSHVEVTR